MWRSSSNSNPTRRGHKNYYRNSMLITRSPKGHITCTWVLWDLASCQVSLNSIKRFKSIFKNISANQRSGWPSCFSDRPDKHKLGRGHWDFGSCLTLLNFAHRFHRRTGKWISQSEAGGHLVSPIGSKHTNLVEDVKILRPLKFRLILLNSCRGVDDVMILLPVQVSSNPFSVLEEKSKTCLGKSEARSATLVFWSAWKTQTWQRTLRSCFLSSFVEFRWPFFEEK